MTRGSTVTAVVLSQTRSVVTGSVCPRAGPAIRHVLTGAASGTYADASKSSVALALRGAVGPTMSRAPPALGCTEDETSFGQAGLFEDQHRSTRAVGGIKKGDHT